MLRIEYLPGARRHFDESFDWYASRSAQTAIRFMNAIDVALTAVVADPDRFATADRRHRGCPVARFPFRVVYRVIEDRVLIVAIAHATRSPGYWRNRG